MFISFEGIEGCGKSTQVARLAASLESRFRVTVTREPGGTPAGEAIRRLLTASDAPSLSPMTELLLYLADRAQHVQERIEPALARGEIVLCDRFSDSTIAYQGYGRGGNLIRIRELDAMARGGCGPSLTFLLDCPVEVGLARTRGRQWQQAAEDRFEREPIAFHERVQAGFHTLAAQEPERFVLVDSEQPIEDTAACILSEALERLDARGHR